MEHLPKKRKLISKSQQEIEEYIKIFKDLKYFDDLIVELRKLVDFEPNILSQINDIRKKSIVQWNWKDVCTHFKLNPNSSLPTFKPIQAKLPQSVIKEISDRLELTTLTHGAMEYGKEARRNYFVNNVLEPILKCFWGKIRIEDEGEIRSLDTNGEVEFVLFAFDLAIIFVIESKTEDMMKGKTQLFLELATVRYMNKSKRVDLIPLYGVVTTAQLWRFYRFDGNKFEESEQIYQIHPNKFTDVAENIYSMLFQSYVKTCEIIADMWKKDDPDNEQKVKSCQERALLSKDLLDKCMNTQSEEESLIIWDKMKKINE